MGDGNYMSYYPTYAILDNMVSLHKGTKNLNIFVDLKNTMQSLYLTAVAEEIVENSSMGKYIDSSIFTSILEFLSFHKKYEMSRGIKINTYIFFETGKSVYHLNLFKDYKCRRHIDDLYGLDRSKRDFFVDVVQKNFMLIEKVCNIIPNVKTIRIDNLEADFIPYYLIKNNLVSFDNSLNVIYSTDHDMLQCLALDANVAIFSKVRGNKKIFAKGTSFENYFKLHDMPDEYFTIAMAILGDGSDDIPGISGIGPARLSSFLKRIIEMSGGVDTIRNNCMSGKQIFNSFCKDDGNKYLNSVIDEEEKNGTVSRNLKLVDFELISRALDDKLTLEMYKRVEHIQNIMNNNKIVDKQLLHENLVKKGVFIQDQLNYIYL